jgi:TRAP-type transport system periplasmic protein
MLGRSLKVLGVAAALACAHMGAALAQEPVVLRTGSFAPPGSVFLAHWLKFKDNVERDSKGTIKVDLNTNDPNEGNLLSNVRRGRVDCVGTSLQGAATILPEVAVLQMPYLFANYKQVDAAYDAGLTDNFRKLFAAKGVAFLQFVEVGFTHMYGTVPIKAVGDVKGVKLRATQARASQAWIKGIGAEPVVMPIAEAMPGLQTGLIKGGESGIVVYSAIIAKAAPQYTLTSHAFDSGTIMCNKEFFDKLKPEQQAAVQKAWNSAEQARDVRAANDRFVANAAAAGVTIHRPSAAEQAQWQAAGKKVTEDMLAAMGPESKKIYYEIQRDIASAK